MKGCFNYTDEATSWQGDKSKNPKSIRMIVIIGFVALIALLIFFVWPKLSSDNFSVETAQATTNVEVENNVDAKAAIPQTNVTNHAITNDETADLKIVVYITGAIKTCGVFELASNARINDLIIAAGGLGENAAINYINLASNLQDGTHVHIPTLDEVASGEANRIAQSGASGQKESGVNTSSEFVQNQAKVNINTSGVEELKTLTGIGEATAKKIIEYREKHGDFKSTEELKDVSGIGDKKFESLADMICV